MMTRASGAAVDRAGVHAVLESYRRSCLLAVVVLALSFCAGTARASDDDRVPGQIIVELLPGASIPAIEQTYHCHQLDYIPEFAALLVEVNPGYDVDTVVAQMLADRPGNGIEDAEPHRRFENPEGVQVSIPILDRTATPDTFANQPAAQTVHRAAALTVQQGYGVLVAILDNGIDIYHPEIRSQIWRLAGANFADGADRNNVLPQPDGIDNDLDGSIDEAVGHGTLVAGLVKLAAPQARLMPVRVLDEDGRGEAFDVARGILFAIRNHADVINCSFGMLQRSGVIAKAIGLADQDGIVVVAAAGNRNLASVDYPADFSSVIAVAAVDDNKVKTTWTNYGSKVDLTAPALGPLSPFGTADYAHQDGTSFAAPLVSGAVALLVERYPCLSPGDVRTELRATAQPDNNGPAWQGKLGSGVLDLDALARTLTSDRCSLRVTQTLAGSVVQWSPVRNESKYDLVRGDVAALHISGVTVDLGPLTCLAPGTTSTSNDASPDAFVPPWGKSAYYLFGDSAGYGSASNWYPRVATSGSCPPTP